jgi:hypothetical protein
MGGRATRSDPAASAAEVLYGLPLGEFIAERKRVAQELRAEGQTEAATKVAAMAKPSVSAWVVNRLHRDAGDDMDALFEAGQRMRDGDMAASRDQRAVLARLNQRAGEVLRADGHGASQAMLRRITTTLQALSALGSFDPDPPGQLVADRDPPGFDFLGGAAPPVRQAKKPAREAKKPAEAKAKSRPAAEPEPPQPSAEERRRQQRIEAQRKLLERAATQAQRRADTKASELADLRAELERAEATAERLREACRSAEEELAEARAAVDEATLALEDD